MDTRFPNDVSINPLPENPNNNSLITLHENPLHYLLLINKCVAQHEKKMILNICEQSFRFLKVDVTCN
jgi:hypothetical protein